MISHEANLYVDQDASPRFCRARPVPYALLDKVEAELECLMKEGIIQPVQFADWAAPIVPVVKADKKSLRICGDFKLTVNQALKLDRYPIPKIEDLFAKLVGGKRFTKLNMSQVYQQIPLEECSKKLWSLIPTAVCFNTTDYFSEYHQLLEYYGVSFKWNSQCCCVCRRHYGYWTK